MSVVPLAHKHRHYKTLVLLVLSMTFGTIFLFWIGNLSPVTPLRGTHVASVWTDIAVRPVSPEQARGLYHLRIDEQGRVFRMQDWDSAWQARRSNGTIQIVLNVPGADRTISTAQRRALARLLADLSRRFQISDQRVSLAAAPSPAYSAATLALRR